MPFLYLGLALLAGSVLLLEVALTRVFAITMWHHLAYMVVSLAMLGFGAAGSLMTARRTATREGPAAPALAGLSCAYGLAVFLAFFLVSKVQVDTLEIWSRKENVLRMGITAAALFLPFLFAGCAIGMALTRFAKQANRLYFYDLVGSAIGGCASVWLLASLGCSAVVLLAGTLGVLSGTVFALAAGRRVLLTTLVPLAVAVGLFVAFVAGPLGESWQLPFAPGKEFTTIPNLVAEQRLHSSTAEVEVGQHMKVQPIIGGDFGLRWVGNPTPDGGRIIGQDGAAPTMLFKNAVDYAEMEFLGETQAASAYVAHDAVGGSDPNVLVIGVGGGVDVMVALHHDARRVTAVEINQAMLDLVTEHYDDYVGGLFRAGAHEASDRIRLVHGEGRSFARSSDERFDIIQMSGVDSFTALSTGAYTLSESYLYTVEAVKDFYEHLEEGGYINYSRFILTYPQRPRETLRLANIAYAALEELGVEDPASQIAVYRGQTWASTVIKRGAFTQPELDALTDYAGEYGFWGLVFDPLNELEERTEPHVGTDRVAQWLIIRQVVGGEIRGLDPSTPKPELVTHLIEGFRAGLSGDYGSVDRIVDELVTHAAASEREASRASVRAALDATIGQARQFDLSFTRTQEDFHALLRGSPEERVAFLADYEYDLSACTDNDPFFFNYFRWGNILKQERTKTERDLPYTNDYPVGHIVLVSSLIQITLLGALLILLPLRRLPKDRTPAGARLRVFAYFAALGAGFMLVEIVLMQKMVLFLGHPTYAISVVLTSILAFAGIGSLLAARLDASRRVSFGWLALVIPVVVLLEAIFVNTQLTSLLGLSFTTRIAVVVVMLAPLGLVLGMPFPLGLRHLEAHWPDLLPWAWAINAFLSVFSSIFCILLGMAIGFSNVLIAGALVYALGLSCLATGRRPVPVSGRVA